MELMLGPRYLPRDLVSLASCLLESQKSKCTTLYVRRRRLVIHLIPVSLGKNLTKENPIDRFDSINLAKFYHQRVSI
jgi:hypothetical protein